MIVVDDCITVDVATRIERNERIPEARDLDVEMRVRILRF